MVLLRRRDQVASGPGTRDQRRTGPLRQGSTPAAVKPALQNAIPPARPGAPTRRTARRGRRVAGSFRYVHVMSAGAPWRRARPGGRGSQGAGQPDRGGPARSGHGRRRRLRRGRRDGGHRARPVRRGGARPGPAPRARRRGVRQPGRGSLAGADPDADRRHRGRGPGGRAQPGRRRLPGQALRVRRAHRAGAGARPAQPGHPARGHRGRPGGGPGPAPGQPGRAAARADPQRVRRPGDPDQRGRRGGERRGPAGERVGRARGPVQQHGVGHAGTAAAQAGGPAGHRDGDRQRLPAPGTLMSGSGLREMAGRRPIRLRLTLTYSVLFVLAGAMLLAFTYVLVVRGLQSPGGVKPPAGLSAAFKETCAKAMKAPTPADHNLIGKCEHAFRAGVTAGAASQRTDAVHQLLLYSLIGLAVIGLVSGLVGWVVAGRALRPVHAITSAARKASEENLGERLGLQGPQDELRELGEVFVGMLARLDDMAVEVRAAVDRAEALIEALLTLARSDRGVLTREHTDLAVLAEDALDTAAPAIQARSLRLETALGHAPTSGDSVLLERMVANLVDNAARHNPAGGWIQVATGIRGSTAFLDVANGGPVLPTDLAPQLFEPFLRANGGEDDGQGAGLGLSIVRSVAAAHAGRAVASSRPAGGLEVSVLLPGDPSAPAPGRADGEMVAGATDGQL